MKQLKVIIVDDEQDSIDLLVEFIHELNRPIQIMATCNSADEAIQAISLHRPDLVFLDVEMPEKNGFDVLKAFQLPWFKVIFVSSYGHYALRAIKFSAVDYILKPVDMQELGEAIDKAGASLHNDRRIEYLNDIDPFADELDRVILSSQKGFRTVKISDILCIESQSGNYTIFELTDGSKTIATKALSHYEELFNDTSLFRVHRAAMINLQHVVAYENGRVELDNGANYEIAHRRRGDFNTRLRSHYSD